MSRYSGAEFDAILAARVALNPAANENPRPDGGHIAHQCAGGREDSACMFCDGGLFACSTCGSFEGATTTQCPGQPLTEEESDAVYAGYLDFRRIPDDGRCEWFYGPSIHTPALWRLACERAGVLE
jgi:hypothetical protein